MTYIPQEHTDAFVAFMNNAGQALPENIMDVSDDDWVDYLVSTVTEPGSPITINPTSRDLNRLGAGAVVMIRFSHMADDPRHIFSVKLAKVQRSGYTYRCSDGAGRGEMVEEAPMVFWDWTQLPESQHPHESVRDNLTTLDVCNGSHIVRIYDYGTPQVFHRNALYERAQELIQQYRDTNARYDIAGLQKPRSMGPPHEGHAAWNRSWNDHGNFRRTAKGQYNGNIFELAKAILSRRPMLNVPYEPDLGLFLEAFYDAGCPGRVGAMRHYRWSHILELIDKKTARHHINVKAFQKWVLRNYRRFFLSRKDYIAMQMEICRQADLDEYNDYVRDMDREHGDEDVPEYDDDMGVLDYEHVYPLDDGEGCGHIKDPYEVRIPTMMSPPYDDSSIDDDPDDRHFDD
jgi:hypothetical protein